MTDPFVTRWDNFLGDEAQTSQLDGLERYRPVSGTEYHWLDFGAEVGGENAVERLILRVSAAVHAAGRVDASGCCGVEYWTNVLKEGQRFRSHFDKDELLWQKARQLRHPLVSTVYYPAHCACEGGELMINRFSIKPAPDTLVAFAGNLRHCVRLVTKGVRWSIAMNFWDTAPEVYSGQASHGR